MPLETVNYLLALGTLGLQIAAAALLAVYFLRRIFPDLEDIAAFVRTRGIWVALAVSFGASAMTLIHSQIFGLPPCPLCWWQRIFLYPQVILFAGALFRGEQQIVDYSIVFSVIGLGFALYHHALQMLPAGSLPCPAEGVSCSQILFLEFGYITYPMMAVSLFAFLIVTMLFVREQ